MTDIQKKLTRVREEIRRYRSAVVCFSGGVDSTLMSRLAFEELGDDACALVGISPSIPQREIRDAEANAALIGIRLIKRHTHELDDPSYSSNPMDRCFHCKSELFHQADRLRHELGLEAVFDGSNIDDKGDYRPGSAAKQRYDVTSPMAAAGLTKADIRAILAHLGMEIYEKPAFACLASRLPYGVPITGALLGRIETMEDFLAAEGFKTFRARVHQDELLRLELQLSELPRLLEGDRRPRLVALALKEGFNFVTLDIEGLMSGKMNRLLKTVT